MNSGNHYKWQEECLSVWEKNGCLGIVQAVTGAGKTILAVKAAAGLAQVYGANLWIAVVVPTRALMVQWNRILRSHLSDESVEDGATFQVYVINSARYQLARQTLQKLQNGTAVFLIADECHHYTGVENRKIFEFVPHMSGLPGRYFALGLSATMGDSDCTEILTPALGQVIFDYSYERALRESSIADFRLIQIAVHFKEDEFDEYDELSERMIWIRRKLLARYPLLKKDNGSFFTILQFLARENGGEIGNLAKTYLRLSYQRKDVVCMAENRLLCAKDLLQEIDIRRKVLIFSERIEQAEMLYALLKDDYGGKVGKYHSKAGKQANENALERFRNSEILVLITCKALDEGIDVPDAEVGIILSGTGMERQRLQRLGRILRKSDKKRTAHLYYLFITESAEERNYVPLHRENFQVEDWEYFPCNLPPFIVE